MKKYNLLILFGVFAMFFSSCEFLDGLDDYKKVDVENTATMPLNGEYWVTVDVYDSTAMEWVADPYGLGYNRIMLFNTSQNRADSIWIDDLGIWPTKAKIACNPANKAFLPCWVGQADVTADSVQVFDGKLIINGATTTGGNITDSIVIELTWESDLGTRYKLAGYRRTGFLEDDH